MTRITPEAAALVERAGKEWSRHKVFMASAEARIRARVEAEMAEERKQSALNVALSMKAAIDGGATKASLRPVTTRDFRTFKGYLDLLNNDEPTTQAAAEQVPAGARAELSIVWEMEDVLRIGLMPSTVAVTSYDRAEPHLWEGMFEVYVRPSDGQVFIDPTGDGGFQVGIAVTEWLRSDETHFAEVLEWVANNPQS